MGADHIGSRGVPAIYRFAPLKTLKANYTSEDVRREDRRGNRNGLPHQ
jgi:hypothetical protein